MCGKNFYALFIAVGIQDFPEGGGGGAFSPRFTDAFSKKKEYKK